MSKLEELIAELCPDGVEYVSFGDICSIITKQTGFDYTNHIKDSLVRDKITDCLPYIQTKFFTGKTFNFETDYYVPFHIVEKFPKITLDSKCILLSIVGASIGNIGLFPGDRKCFLGGAICVAKPHESYNVDYLFYYLTSRDGQKQIFNKVKGAGQATVTIEDIRKFKIPIPPLPVQSEIVRILDNLTELTEELIEELTKELTARKKQYEYYLDKFYGDDYEGMLKMADNPSVKILPLSEVGTLTRGKRFVKADSEGLMSGVPCLHYGELYTYYGVSAEKAKSFVKPELATKLRFATKGDVVIVGAGENNIDIGVGVAWFGDEDIAVHDACYTLKHNQNPKYISYYLRTNIYHNQIKKYVSEGKICSISASGLGKALIPIPSIEEQNRIVSIIERFDNLCNDISKGLPAEIEARQKQYEYYRDKLLTFKELS